MFLLLPENQSGCCTASIAFRHRIKGVKTNIPTRDTVFLCVLILYLGIHKKSRGFLVFPKFQLFLQKGKVLFVQNINANIDKIKCLAKERGLKIKFICGELGLSETYLSNCKNGKDRMTEDRLRKIAEILGTTYEYLTDQTDDPLPTLARLADMAASLEERIIHEVMDKIAVMTDDQLETVRRLFALPDEEFGKALELLNVLWK